MTIEKNNVDLFNISIFRQSSQSKRVPFLIDTYPDVNKLILDTFEDILRLE